MSNARPFRFGVKVATDPGDIPTREGWIALARKAEDLGYATFSVADHYINEMLPIAALMYVADATSTLRIGSCVFDVNYRHPALLAKEVAAIDWFSGGRFELGLGAGSLRVDYDAVGQPFDPPGVRVQRLTESVAIFKQFFIQDSVTFAGEHYRLTELPAFPKPAQRPHPPIFIGGGGKKVLSLAAREADIIGVEAMLQDDQGTSGPGERTEVALARKVAMIQEVAGARFADIELNYGFRTVIVANDQRLAAERYAHERGREMTPEQVLADPYLLIGTVDQMVETLQRRREQCGVSYLQVFFQDIDAFAPVVARLVGT
ncbi:MAG TPA: TIGR03621 family F420-dependent LLM class oxidoreductase [Ktedonobacterales bacterium]|nr:TIGR03621 family F420-dependent LLM class oxidoreductase [Ktedonobacterales bacterium]